MSTVIKANLAILCLCLLGCATTDPKESRERVAKAVKLQIPEVTNDEKSAMVAKRVKELLGKPFSRAGRLRRAGYFAG